MAERRPVAPRTFFLNETHEHARNEQEGGGRFPTFSRIPWSEKGRKLAASLSRVRAAAAKSVDPLRGTRFFVLASPDTKVEQDSESKKAKAAGGVRHIDVSFSREHARTFERLGLDLLGVTAEGDALVHAKPETLDQLEATAARLGDAGKREQARWALLGEFRLPPMETRVDVEWLKKLDAKEAHEVIVEFQPILRRDEADRLIGAIGAELTNDNGELVAGAGRDLSGRRWLRAQMRPDKIKRFAKEFQSIQAIHAPLMATLFASPSTRKVETARTPSEHFVSGDLPTVAVVDAGVPREHPHLAPYRRGQYRHPEAEQTDPGDHGSRVASRVVFGDVTVGPGFVPPAGQCRFLDVVLPAFSDGDDGLELDGKMVFEALQSAAQNYPDVRVFNLSFGSYLALGQLSETDKRQRLVEIQDLDNFAFQHDLVVVVAAGNTRPGVVPNVDYPNHLDDPDWGLGAWATGYNTLVVGGYVPRTNTDGVAKRLGWPSPFTRIGTASVPVPGFSASAGDCSDNYQWKAGLGVWTSNKSGDWEDVVGTSHAAPIVAREAALLLRDLQKFCPTGVRPFASTAKAFLNIVARHEGLGRGFPTKLATRTLGRGRPAAERLAKPTPNTAVYLWQGTLERPRHSARVRVPLPRGWLSQATAPRVRVVCAWNTLTNAGAPEIWACRKVTVQLRPSLDADAPRARGNTSGAYPLIDKTYDLGAEHLEELKITLASDEWVLEVGYEDIAPYLPLLGVEDHQRVSVALEIFDQDGSTLGPQAAIQAMPIADTMIHLGGVKQPIWAPIRIPTG